MVQAVSRPSRRVEIMTYDDAAVYLQTFLREYEYPSEATETLSAGMKELYANAGEDFKVLIKSYAQNKYIDFQALIKRAGELAEKAELSPYTVYLLVFILLSKVCEAYYLAEGYSRDIWRDNFFDLKYKAIECRLVKGVWGTFVPEWFARFYQVERFTFGLLQFEIVNFDKRFEENVFHLTGEDKVINIHIPRTGNKLFPQEVDRACTRASAFFKENFGFKRIIFQCESWLLFPKNKQLLKPDSNLYSFISRFTIVGSGEFENYNEVWRLFDCEYTGDIEKLPTDTSFRRAYVDWMKKGEKTGWGYGIYPYDEE